MVTELLCDNQAGVIPGSNGGTSTVVGQGDGPGNGGGGGEMCDHCRQWCNLL